MRTAQNMPKPERPLGQKHSRLIWLFLFVVLPLVSSIAQAKTDADEDRSVNFNLDISPILSKHCLECHGPDANQRKAGLRLDLFEAATAPRKPKPAAILPGDSAASLLIQRITSNNPDERMPPPENLSLIHI